MGDLNVAASQQDCHPQILHAKCYTREELALLSTLCSRYATTCFCNQGQQPVRTQVFAWAAPNSWQRHRQCSHKLQVDLPSVVNVEPGGCRTVCPAAKHGQTDPFCTVQPRRLLLNSPRTAHKHIATDQLRSRHACRYTDVWRKLHPDTGNVFTVWDEYTSARMRNEVGSARLTAARRSPPVQLSGCQDDDIGCWQHDNTGRCDGGAASGRINRLRSQ